MSFCSNTLPIYFSLEYAIDNTPIPLYSVIKSEDTSLDILYITKTHGSIDKNIILC